MESGGGERLRACEFGVEQLGDSEIEQLRNAIGGDQDVARFEIAVNDELLMRVLDGVGHLPEQLQALANGQLAGVSEGDQGFAVDALHNNVRRTVGGRSAFEQTGDVGVFELSQDLAFLQEAPPLGFRPGAHPQDLDGDSLAELVVVADALVDRAHAAFAENSHDAVRPDHASGRQRRLSSECGRGVQGRGESPGGRRVREKRFQFGADFGIAAMGGHPSRPIGFRYGAGFFEEPVKQRHLLLGHLRDGNRPPELKTKRAELKTKRPDPSRSCGPHSPAKHNGGERLRQRHKHSPLRR